MGSCWTQCCRRWRGETDRIRRGGGSKYFRSTTTGQRYNVEFENLVESDEEVTMQSCPSVISEEELGHLREHQYAAITQKQTLIDQRLQAELALQEEKLRLEEEAVCAAQREAARLLRGHRQQEVQKMNAVGESEGRSSNRGRLAAESGAVACSGIATHGRSLSKEPGVTNRISNDDSLELEWEDEEGMAQVLPARQRSGTEEDILWAALSPVKKGTGEVPGSALEEWEHDFVTADASDSEFDSFVTAGVATPSINTPGLPNLDLQERSS